MKVAKTPNRTTLQNHSLSKTPMLPLFAYQALENLSPKALKRSSQTKRLRETLARTVLAEDTMRTLLRRYTRCCFCCTCTELRNLAERDTHTHDAYKFSLLLSSWMRDQCLCLLGCTKSHWTRKQNVKRKMYLYPIKKKKKNQYNPVTSFRFFSSLSVCLSLLRQR